MISDFEPLSVRRLYRRQTCWKACGRRARYVVQVAPLCPKHALEAFTRNLKQSMEAA